MLKYIVLSLITFFFLFVVPDPTFADIKIDPNKITFPDSSTQTSASGGGSSQWITNGSDIYYNAGEVGIGTTTPDELLEVYGTLNPTVLVSAPSSTSPQYHLTRGSDTWIMWVDSNNYFNFNKIGPGNLATISSDGKFGIGQSEPSQKLEVDNGNILVQGTGSFDSAGDEAILYLGDTHHYIKAKHTNYVQIGTYGTNNTITLNQNGYVGILMTPSAVYQSALQVKGAMHLMCSTNSEGNGIGTDSDGKLVFYRNSDLTTPWIYMDDETGNFGIGISDPNAPLSIIADSVGTNIRLDENSGGEFWNIGVDANGHLEFAPSGTTRVIFEDNGNVGIGTTDPGYPLTVSGNAAKTTGTAWLNISDLRLKDITGDYPKGLDEIMGLNPVTFYYKENNPINLPSNEEHIGFVAQEVEPFFPEAVHERDDGYLDFDLHPVSVAMVNAIQELKMECDRLRAKNESLAAENQMLRDDILQIKRALGL